MGIGFQALSSPLVEAVRLECARNLEEIVVGREDDEQSND